LSPLPILISPIMYIRRSDVELALGKSADEREELETAERLMLAYKRDKEIEVKVPLGEDIC